MNEHLSLGPLGSNVDLSGRNLRAWHRAQGYRTLRPLGRLDELGQRTLWSPRSAIITWPADNPDEETIVAGESVRIGGRRGMAWSAVHVFVPIEAPQLHRCGQFTVHDSHQIGPDQRTPEDEQSWVCLGGGIPGVEELAACNFLEGLHPGEEVIVDREIRAVIAEVMHEGMPDAGRAGMGVRLSGAIANTSAPPDGRVTVAHLAAGKHLLCRAFGMPELERPGA